MAIGPRLDLRHSQQLVMTPQLQQAIKLLALSNLELEAVATQLVGDALELSFCRLARVVVVIPTATVGVDDDELGLAQPRLLDRSGEGCPPFLGRYEPDDDGHDFPPVGRDGNVS